MSENQTAVSVYSQDGMDDFPVLKAFQQYIDSEQAKARKRMFMLGVFFCILIGAIIAVFVAMLASVTARNQQLNDRLVDFAMRERAVPQAAAARQPSAQDDSMLLAMTARLDEMQRKLDESRAKAEKEAAVAAERARLAAQQQTAKPKTPSAEELEIQRLKALLEIERQKAAAEKERRRQEELEAYRRKRYPELYETQTTDKQAGHPRRAAKPAARKTQDVDDEIDAIVAELDDDRTGDGAISYFDEDERPAPKATPNSAKKAQKPAGDSYRIPVESKKTGGRRWHIPAE